MLEEVSFEAAAGTTTAVMGKSGSGKSTLLSLISGILKPDAGEIELAGQRYSDLDENNLSDLRASSIGFVFQNFHLVSYLNALENVLLPLKVCGRDDKGEADAANLLGQVGLAERLDHLPAQLSGGEKQRVALARALIHEPQLILADEPSGSLDEETGEEIMDLLFGLVAQTRACLVLVTHSPGVAGRCERILRIEKGRVKPVEPLQG